MIEEEKKTENTENSVESVPVPVEKAEIVPVTEQNLETQIDNIKDTDSYNEFLPIFNLSIKKKQAMRVLKREEIKDKTLDLIHKRIDKRPEEISLSELTAIDKTMSEQGAKELSTINTEHEQSASVVNQHTNNTIVMVNNGLNDEENAHVLDAISEILKQASIQTDIPEEEPQSENVVYNNDDSEKENTEE